MTPYVRNILFAAAFVAGWSASNWHSDSLELVAVKAAQASAHEVSGNNLKTAEKIQLELSRIKSNEKTIIRENVKLVDRPVYHNVCLDDDGVRNANAARTGFDPSP
ncbi:hypothetical protein [uncultured Sphingomonas sp.]|uniref:hypothetical protein n=1 Tax=uncultured Sphingomonas sp. TaxID=158754 RepID=UPI002595C01B|nr:hypothetical protein [uncultured Sphingomonas sp.]